MLYIFSAVVVEVGVVEVVVVVVLVLVVGDALQV